MEFEFEFLTVGDLRRILDDTDIKDDVKVYYERIEDEYFEEGGWENDILMEDSWYNIGTDHNPLSDNWIRAFDVFYNEKENVLKITAHY